MAFVLNLPSEGQLMPLAGIVLDNGEAVVSYPIGYDDQDQSTYFVVTAISPYPGCPNLEHCELSFFIVKRQGDGEATYYHDGLETKSILSEKRDRAVAILIIRNATKMILDRLTPEKVHICTSRANLPDKALDKYRILNTLFRECGYDARECDVYHGRYMWVMVKD